MHFLHKLCRKCIGNAVFRPDFWVRFLPPLVFSFPCLVPTYAMKTNLFIFCLSLLATFGAQAQMQPKPITKKHYWVVKTGVVRAALKATPLLIVFDDRPNIAYGWPRTPFQTGFQLEAGREWKIFRAWRVMAGLGYRRYGGTYKNTRTAPDYDNFVHYLNGVALGRFIVLPDDKVSPYIVGGARFGHVVSSTRHELAEKFLYREQPFRTIDVVPALGVGLEFPLLGQRFFAEVEYSHGINSSVAPRGRFDSNIQNRAVAFTLGAKF
jgi:hypothetical protein